MIFNRKKRACRIVEFLVTVDQKKKKMKGYEKKDLAR